MKLANFEVGLDRPFFLISGPCVIESEALCQEVAGRLLEATRGELLAALLAAPAEPAERWTQAHPFGATMLELPRHDRHHAEQIKNARISS